MPEDADDLIPLASLGSVSETDVVYSLLQSEGIRAVLRGRYNPKGPQQILVPQTQLEEARRVVDRARGSALQAPLERPEEPRSIGTAVTWVLGGSLAIYALLVMAKMAASLLRHWFR